MSEPKGQILPDSVFGRILTGIAKRSRVIVEIGAWRGEGSTRCLVNGMVTKDQFLWSVEMDPARAAEAQHIYRNNKNVIVICARALDVLDLLPPQIDLLLLDGGIEDSVQEFKALGPRSKVVALDDTNDPKNQVPYKEMKEAKNIWASLYDSQGDRNGWAVFERL